VLSTMKRTLLAVLLLVIGVFSPALIPLLWHFRHGDVVEYKGKLVPVPRNWYPSVEFQRLDISQPPLTVFFLWGPAPAWSFLEPLSGPRPTSVEEGYRSFETYYRAYRVTPGNDVTGPLRMGHGDGEASCMKQSPIRGDGSTTVSCLLFAGTWMAEFVGRTNAAEDFLQIIRGTQEK
jgi:hypothetical protein